MDPSTQQGDSTTFKLTQQQSFAWPGFTFRQSVGSSSTPRRLNRSSVGPRPRRPAFRTSRRSHSRPRTESPIRYSSDRYRASATPSRCLAGTSGARSSSSQSASSLPPRCLPHCSPGSSGCAALAWSPKSGRRVLLSPRWAITALNLMKRHMLTPSGLPKRSLGRQTSCTSHRATSVRDSETRQRRARKPDACAGHGRRPGALFFAGVALGHRQ